MTPTREEVRAWLERECASLAEMAVKKSELLSELALATAALALIDEGEKDKQRIEWQEANRGRVVASVTEWDEQGKASRTQWIVWHQGLWRAQRSFSSEPFDTWREAVDYAMSEPLDAARARREGGTDG